MEVIQACVKRHFQKIGTAAYGKGAFPQRDMSLSLGQNPGYINSIENNKTFPSMSNFFEICDYLNITPMEFFDLESAHPEKIRTLTEQLKRLDAAQLDSILRIVNGLVSNHPY